MILVIFRFHAKPDADLQELDSLSQKMGALVSEIPGFLGLKDFAAEDGEVVVVAEFDSMEAVDSWKAHPDHLVAQGRGRDEFFADYRINVCSSVRSSEFTAD